jgi:hypothetical protein
LMSGPSSVTLAHDVCRGEGWALALAGGLAVVSLVVCVLGLPVAATGIAINLAMLGAVAYVAVLKPG